MKTKEQKEKFIQLRAEGNSFESISKNLNISKTTLISWSNKLKKEVNNLEFLKYQSILEQYKLTKHKRIEFLSGHINKINEALDSKDYKELSIQELLGLKDQFVSKLHKETNEHTYQTGITEIVKSSEYGFNEQEIQSERRITLD